MRPRAEIDQLRKRIEQLQQGSIDRYGEPEAVRAIGCLWTLTQAWTAEYLNAHPQASAREILADLAPLAKAGDLSPSVVRLKGDAVVVSLDSSFQGTVFIVSRTPPQPFAVTWDIRTQPAIDWPDASMMPWVDTVPGVHGGPLGGRVLALPPTPIGPAAVPDRRHRARRHGTGGAGAARRLGVDGKRGRAGARPGLSHDRPPARSSRGTGCAIRTKEQLPDVLHLRLLRRPPRDLDAADHSRRRRRPRAHLRRSARAVRRRPPGPRGPPPGRLRAGVPLRAGAAGEDPRRRASDGGRASSGTTALGSA